MTFALSILLCLTLNLDPASNIAVGDEAFFRIDYPTAVSSYQAVLQTHPLDFEILWRLARVFVCMGEVADEERRQQLFDAAERYARRSVEADSTRSEGHTWLAAALGYTAFYAGLSDRVKLSHDIKNEFGKALAINPNDDAAHSIKGSFYRAMGNVGWLQRGVAKLLYGGVPDGGFEEGEAALKQAIALAPDVMRHHYELGVLYLDWGRPEEAKRTLQRALLLPVRVAIDRPRLERIKSLLSELQKSE